MFREIWLYILRKFRIENLLRLYCNIILLKTENPISFICYKVSTKEIFLFMGMPLKYFISIFSGMSSCLFYLLYLLIQLFFITVSRWWLKHSSLNCHKNVFNLTTVIWKSSDLDFKGLHTLSFTSLITRRKTYRLTELKVQRRT